MKIIDTNFRFDDGATTCMITTDTGDTFIGQAFCHEADQDMYSERTGGEIAFRRAKMKMLKAIRTHEIRPALKALKHLSGCMVKSVNFNAKSYENKMLQRQIRQLEFDLTTINEMLTNEKQSLKDYIAGKEKIFKRIRAKNQDKND